MEILINILLLIFAFIATLIGMLTIAYIVHCVRSYKPKQFGYSSPANFDMHDTIQAEQMKPRTRKSDVDDGEVLHMWDEQGGTVQ